MHMSTRLLEEKRLDRSSDRVAIASQSYKL